MNGKPVIPIFNWVDNLLYYSIAKDTEWTLNNDRPNAMVI